MLDSLPSSLKNKLLGFANARLLSLFLATPWALDKLKPHQGKQIQLIIDTWVIPLLINDQGIPEFIENSSSPSDLSITIARESLLNLIKHPHDALHFLHIQGNSALANDLGFVAKYIRPDLEELLSHFTGDLLAHRAALLASASVSYSKSLFHVLKTSVIDYLTEEKRWLIQRYEFNDWCNEIDEINQKLKSLEDQINKKS